MRYGEYEGGARIKEAGSLVGACLGESNLCRGLNEYKARMAWNSHSGAASRTLGCSLSRGILYVRLSSSLLRSRLYPRLGTIRDAVNAELSEDPTFTRRPGDTSPVKKIILQ